MNLFKKKKIFRAIGLMSGTSMDGIDLALIESDGKKIIRNKNFTYRAYSKNFKEELKKVIYATPTLEEIKKCENKLTILNAKLVNDFLKKNNLKAKDIDLIGFHGHTILHKPEIGITWQIGNCDLLANLCQINVVSDFRCDDVTLGGQGAPLVPIYHFYLLQKQKKPLVVLNIGGISNITYFKNSKESEIEAFDVCFGNAPMDDLVKEKLGKDFDKNGALAQKGKADLIVANHILQNEIFNKKPPKSFDRDDFSTILAPINNLKLEDALATFSYMHAKAIKMNFDLMNYQPKSLIICGGGRKNKILVNDLKNILENVEIILAEDENLDGDAIEAQAFAFLAIRSVRNLPISFSKTTGVKKKGGAVGGTLYSYQ